MAPHPSPLFPSAVTTPFNGRGWLGASSSRIIIDNVVGTRVAESASTWLLALHSSLAHQIDWAEVRLCDGGIKPYADATLSCIPVTDSLKRVTDNVRESPLLIEPSENLCHPTSRP